MYQFKYLNLQRIFEPGSFQTTLNGAMHKHQNALRKHQTTITKAPKNSLQKHQIICYKSTK